MCVCVWQQCQGLEKDARPSCVFFFKSSFSPHRPAIRFTASERLLLLSSRPFLLLLPCQQTLFISIGILPGVCLMWSSRNNVIGACYWPLRHLHCLHLLWFWPIFDVSITLLCYRCFAFLMSCSWAVPPVSLLFLFPPIIVLTYHYPSIYTVAVQVGRNGQNFALQVDMGSSDLICTNSFRDCLIPNLL